MPRRLNHGEHPLFERLVIAETMSQGPLEVRHGPKEPIMGGASAQHLPKPLDDLELRAVTGSGISLYMRERGEHLGDHGTLMPRRPVGHEHDPRVLRRRIGAGDIPEVPGKPLLPGALF